MVGGAIAVMMRKRRAARAFGTWVLVARGAIGCTLA